MAATAKIGAWSLEDVVAVDPEEFFVEVAVERERSSLRVKPIIPNSLGPHDGCLVFLSLCVLDIPVLLSNVFLLGFAIPRRAVDADVEDRTTPEGWKEKLIGEGFGEGLYRALRLGAWSFFWDGLEGRSGAPAYMQHVDGWRRLDGELVGEWTGVSHLVGEFSPQASW